MCLRALAGQSYPGDCFEVIVVEDGGNGNSAAVVDSFRDQLRITRLEQPHAGPAAARNTGAARAAGQFLAFTDDDCAPDAGWLKSLAARFAQAPDCLIGGKTVNGLPNNPYSATSQAILDVVYEYYNATPDRARFFATNNLALPAARFRALGGLDPAFVTSEDREFCERWLQSGYAMVYAREVVIRHMHDLNLGSLWRQHFHYGCGAFRFHRVRAQRHWGKFRPELGFYAALLSYPLKHLGSDGSPALLPLLMVAETANAVGFLWQAIQP